MSQFKKQTLPVGATIGVCEVKSVMFADRFGILYGSFNHHLNSRVAIYEYFPRLLVLRAADGSTVGTKPEIDENKLGLAEFLKRGETLAGIDHPAAVTVHNVLEFNGTGYFIMDYVDGIPLTRISDRSVPLEEHELKFLLLALLGALGKVHGNGLIHGNIHPSNILLKGNGEPVLVGFATYQAALAAGETFTAKDLHKGYAPAELYENTRRDSPSSDLYSLGACFYRCIQRIEPISAIERVSAISNHGPDSLRSIRDAENPRYSEPFLEAIDWMFHPLADKRPQSAAEVLDLLAPKPHGQSDRVRVIGGTMESKDEHKVMPWIPGLGIAASMFVVLIVVWLVFLDTQQETLSLAGLQSEKKLTDIAPDKNVDSHERKPFIEDNGDIDFAANEIELEAEDTLVSKHSTQQEPMTVTEKREPRNDLSLNAESATELLAAKGTEQDPVDSDRAVRKHLSAARASLIALRLTTPEEDNAVNHYNAVLAADPDNIEANQGLQKVVDTYVWLIGKSIGDGRLKQAKVYLERASAVIPGAPAVEKVRGVLKAAQE